jgi:hypothetical protein
VARPRSFTTGETQICSRHQGQHGCHGENGAARSRRFRAGRSSSDRKKRSRPIRVFSAMPHDGQRPCRILAEDPGRTQSRAAHLRRCSSNMEWSPWPEFGSDPRNPRESRPAQASLPRSWPTPELRIPNAAAQTRMVSMAGIRLRTRESARPFKGIICDDISEFESDMPSHAVWSVWAMSGLRNLAQ